MKCKCGSLAINNHLHGRDGTDSELCDVCYWRKRADLGNEVKLQFTSLVDKWCAGRPITKICHELNNDHMKALDKFIYG